MVYKKSGKNDYFYIVLRFKSAFYTKILRKGTPYGFISLFIKHYSKNWEVFVGMTKGNHFSMEATQKG